MLGKVPLINVTQHLYRASGHVTSPYKSVYDPGRRQDFYGLGKLKGLGTEVSWRGSRVEPRWGCWGEAPPDAGGVT